jgi:16S rRNA (cytosine1402-N4)-methyltransferase
MSPAYHIPVMLKESVDALCIKSGGIYIEATFGGGGHSREIWNRLKGGRLIAIDRDSDAAANAIKDKGFILIHNNFRFIRGLVRNEGRETVDGILADLGVSSYQFDTEERGFSFRFNAPLDMRMSNKSSLTAAKVVNTYSEEQLRYIFTAYGEIDNVGRVVKLLMAERGRKTIHTTGELVEALKPCLPKMMEHKYLAKIFQSLRMEINGEMAALEQFLEQSLRLLKPGGRLAVITYHSLEDRLVKNFMRSGNKEGKVEKDFFGKETTLFKLIAKKAMTPSEEEIKNNTRARSAKLRIAEKI